MAQSITRPVDFVFTDQSKAICMLYIPSDVPNGLENAHLPDLDVTAYGDRLPAWLYPLFNL